MSTLSNIVERNITLERLHSLYELIGRMNSVYELADLLEFIVDRALNLTGGRRGLLLLDDEHEHTLQHVAVTRGEQLDEKQLERALEFVSTTVIKDVLDRGEPRLVFDLPADQRYEGLASEATFKLKRVRSVLAVPLKVAEQLVGLIYIDHPSRAVFGQEDLDFLSAFASQAALAINRARQHQKQVDELTRLNELSRSVVQVLDLNEVLTRIVYEAIHILKVETGSVLLLNEEISELTFNVSVSNGQRVNIPGSLKVGQGIAGWVVATGEIACVRDVTQDERWFGEMDPRFNTRSILCVPLKANGYVLGVLQVLNKRGDQGFNNTDVTLLSAFAASATIAIENARLFQEAREVRRLRDLNKAALRLSSSLDLDTILNAGLEVVQEIFRAGAATISLIHRQPQPDVFSVEVCRDLSPNLTLAQAQIEALNKLSELVFTSEKDDIFIIHKHQIQDYPAGAPLFDIDIQTLALVSIRVGSELKGALALMAVTAHAYSPEEINLLLGIARILGLAIQNATHYEQMSVKTMQLTYLNDIGATLTSNLEVGRVLEVFINSVNALLDTERTSFFLIDEETNELVLRYSNEEESTGIRLPPPWRGIAGWVATHDHPALVNDAFSDPRHLRQIAIETGYDARSILCVPLKIEDKVIGVVEALNKRGDQQFTYEHQALLIQLSHWAAIAIQNARLYEARMQEQKLRIEAESRGAMADLILNMAHTMNNIVGAIRVWASGLEYAAQTTPQAPLVQFQQKLLRLHHNAKEALELIRSIRDPFENLNAELGPTDVHVCLTKAIESCWWPENVSLRRSYADDLPLVWANAKGLEEAVFYNLISNAIQALTPKGGEIRCLTRYLETHWVEIIIADDGPGIPQVLRDRIFHPGISNKEDRLGIGLWMVETFTRRFGGQIYCSSPTGQGTTFRILLPPVKSIEKTMAQALPQEEA